MTGGPLWGLGSAQGLGGEGRAGTEGNPLLVRTCPGHLIVSHLSPAVPLLLAAPTRRRPLDSRGQEDGGTRHRGEWPKSVNALQVAAC